MDIEPRNNSKIFQSNLAEHVCGTSSLNAQSELFEGKNCLPPHELETRDVSFWLASSFLNALDPMREVWDFRTFDDVVLTDGRKRADPRLTRTMRHCIEDAFDQLTSLNASGAGIFVTINRTDGKGRRQENVTQVSAVFADTDGANVVPLLKQQPHVAVQSSNGNFHLYWRVDDCEMSQFKPLQQAIAQRYGTDPVVCDLPRVMRVPGFFHRKWDPVLVDLVPTFMDPGQPPYSTGAIIKNLDLGAQMLRGAQSHTASEKGRTGAPGKELPSIDEMRDMLSYLATKNYFEERKGVEKDGSGRIIKIGWVECGMALKLAYGDRGFDLWAETHLDDGARADAPAQWASFEPKERR